MSEGTARELVARALMDHAVAQNPGLDHFAEGILAHMYHGWADAVLAALTEAGALAPAGTVAVDRALIDRLAFDLDKGNTRSAFGHARYLVDRARSKTAQAAAASAGLTLTKSEREVVECAIEHIASLLDTELAFERRRIEGQIVVLRALLDRSAPAADAAGEPS